MKSNSIVKAIVLITLTVVLGYFREIFFIRAKWFELVLLNGELPPVPHWLFDFLAHLSYKQLIIAKIIGTLVAVIGFWSIALLMVNWFFPDKKNKKIVHIYFLSVFVFSAFLYLVSSLTNLHGVYTFSRWIVGIIETPLAILFLYPLFLLKDRLRS